ncbi:cysteine-rich CWC family protein [Spirosoma pomorum]
MEEQDCPKHASVNCPRCQQSFECRVGSINLCQCQSVTLSDAQRQYIESQYTGCLCANCLQVLRTAYNRLEYDKAISKILYGH